MGPILEGARQSVHVREERHPIQRIGPRRRYLGIARSRRLTDARDLPLCRASSVRRGPVSTCSLRRADSARIHLGHRRRNRSGFRNDPFSKAVSAETPATIGSTRTKRAASLFSVNRSRIRGSIIELRIFAVDGGSTCTIKPTNEVIFEKTPGTL